MAAKDESVRDEGPTKWLAAAPGAQMRAMVEGSGAAIILYRVEPGTTFDLHTHDFSELGVVLAGEGEFRAGEVRRPIHEGDSFYIPPRMPHGFSVPKDGVAVVLLNVNVAVPPDATLPPADELARRGELVVRRTGDGGDDAA